MKWVLSLFAKFNDQYYYTNNICDTQDREFSLFFKTRAAKIFVLSLELSSADVLLNPIWRTSEKGGIAFLLVSYFLYYATIYVSNERIWFKNTNVYFLFNLYLNVEGAGPF